MVVEKLSIGFRREPYSACPTSPPDWLQGLCAVATWKLLPAYHARGRAACFRARGHERMRSSVFGGGAKGVLNTMLTPKVCESDGVCELLPF